MIPLAPMSRAIVALRRGRAVAGHLLTTLGRDLLWQIPQHHHPLIAHVQMDVAVVLGASFAGWNLHPVSRKDNSRRLGLAVLREGERSPIFVEFQLLIADNHLVRVGQL